MKNAVAIALVAVLGAGLAGADESVDPVFSGLSGRVSGSTAPLSYSKVYAYHLSDQSLSKVVTDADGTFRFDRLPAGLYKIIAFKDGFVPAIALLTRSSREAQQYLNLELAPDEAGDDDSKSDFWSVREKVPSDVLRDIELAESPREELVEARVTSRWIDPHQVEARMQAVAGLDQNLELGSTSLAGGRVGVRGNIADLHVDLKGDYVALQSTPGASATADPSGRTQALAVRVDNQSTTDVQISTVNNYMQTPGSPNVQANYVGLARHRLSWSQNLGENGRSDFSAEYSEQSNFFRRAGIEPFGIPDASKSWRVEGSYSAALNQRSTLQTGFRYREREAVFDIEARHIRQDLSAVPAQRVDLFGRGGLQLHPDILVEFGLYSTLRDGSLSLSPSGGMALRLGAGWRAQAQGSLRVHDDESTDTLHPDFTVALFGENSVCQTAEEYCYKVSLAHQSNDQEDLSFGLVHRRFAETLHLYFNRDFFSRLESLYLVQGDNLPELQFAATRRLAPKVLARLSSNVAAGGGGILYATDQTSYENEVRYLVTSLDTQFEHTSTGVFVAFHHLAQQLLPVEGSTHEGVIPEMELERLQVMLTQDLDVLSRLAADWAVHLNMELSRGSAPEADLALDDDELRKRVMGGLTVSF